MIKRSNKKIAYVASVLFACLSMGNTNVFAGAWFGGDSGGGSVPPGDGHTTGATCAESSNRVSRADCVGYSWIYYRYIGGDSNKDNAVIDFPVNRGAKGTYTIGDSSNNCSKMGETSGFWHYGQNGVGSNSSGTSMDAFLYSGGYIGDTYYSFNSWNKTRGMYDEYRYDMVQGNLGHWDTRSISKLPSWGVEKTIGDAYATDMYLPGLGGTSAQKLYKKINGQWVALYQAEKISKSDGQVFTDYKKAYKNKYPNEAEPTSISTNMAAFCYGSILEDQSTTFTATTTVSGDEGKLTKSNYSISFTHTINRNGGTAFSAVNNYSTSPTLNSSSVTGVSGSWTSTQVSTSGSPVQKTVNEPFTGTINPGESYEYCSQISYDSELHTSTTASNKRATTNKVCRKVTRNSATFTGSVTATVKKNSSKTDVTIPANKVINLADSDDGYYEISFTHNVKRNSDGAGENVKTQYSSSRRETSTGGVSAATWSPTDGSSSGDTNALAEGGNQNVWSPKVSGTLKYGESRTFCSSMSYRAKQSSSDALTNATNSEYCITVVRPKAKCLINPSYQYGVKDGKNLGTVGVRNFNSGLEDFSWTTVNSNSADSALAYDNANIWAMPGDDIQFKYGACAGAFYAIEQSKISGKGTHYSTAGWLAKDALGTNGSTTGTRYFGTTNDGYLFKNEANKYANYSSYKNPVNSHNVSLAAINATTALPYATWTTGYNGASKPASGFLSNPDEPVAEMYGNSNGTGIVKSPSSPSTSNYDGDVNNTYKICKSADGQGCILGKQDVGGVIVQQLTWNYLNISNGSVAQGPSNYSATGMVRVPYNYYLQPYVANNTSGVMYLGESGVMDPGIVVYPRENSYIHGGTTYATVTKETHINVKVYNKRTGRVLKSDESVRRLNKDGKTLDGTSETELVDDSFLPNGISFDILDDGYNKVGDKICTEIKIWPIDSHETGDRTPVKGAAKNSAAWDKQYALTESYTTRADGSPKYSATATSCSTIAKRPTMSVESSNAYSATSFTTSLYAKKIGSKKFIFGSWSEYGVFGTIDTSDGKTFVSGAAIGYPVNGNSVSLNAPRENNAIVQVAVGSTSSKTCLFTTQTFVNMVGNTCSTSDVNIGKDSMKDYRDNILRRYGDIKGERNRAKNTTGGRYNLNIGSAEIEKYRIDDGDTTSAIGIYSSGDAVLNSVPAIANGTNRTIVYNVRGTLTISGNINNESSVQKTDPSQITGVIIIADKVWIDASVEYINATIITRETANAEINTCKTDNGVTMTIGNKGTLNSTVCNKTLVFDAPVFTRKIILNRTAGASDGADGAGIKSITRAEIFNLNMANYLWSYEQMSHHGQAETTYIRELPTRY